jgi:hypothetical protein
MRYVSSIEEIAIEDTQKRIALELLQKGMSVEDIVSVTQQGASASAEIANIFILEN